MSEHASDTLATRAGICRLITGTEAGRTNQPLCNSPDPAKGGAFSDYAHIIDRFCMGVLRECQPQDFEQFRCRNNLTRQEIDGSSYYVPAQGRADLYNQHSEGDTGLAPNLTSHSPNNTLRTAAMGGDNIPSVEATTVI